MDFELTEEHLELQRVVREVAERECPPALVRAVLAGDDDARAFWKTLVQLDLPGLTVAADEGGSGATPVELVICLEEMGRVADPSPFLATAGQYVPLVRECLPAGEARAALLGAACSGGTGAAAFASDTVTARRDGEAWVLDGTARHVLDGDRAEEVAVVARAEGHDGVFVVPGAALAAQRTPSFDGTLHLAEAHLDGVRVPPERAAAGPDAARGVARAREEAVTGVAAVTVGASQRVLEFALEHVRERKQFGVPIGSFQAVKHMAVDVYVAIQRARALCHFAALTIAEDDDRRTAAASMAKAAAGDCQRITARHGVQMYGGLGFTWENDMQLYMRRAKAGELLLGSSTAHRAVVARWALGATDRAGATA